MKNVREIIADNLTYLRKENKFTQAEIADKFNYSDKAVSKWENGDTLPDIETLNSLAKFYGVTLDYLVNEREENSTLPSKKMDKNETNKIASCALMASIIWIIATIVFVYFLINKNDVRAWAGFVWAVPVSLLIVLGYDNRYFKNRLLKLVLLSIIFWSSLASVFITIGVVKDWGLWPLMLVGIPIQISLLLWYTTKK